MNRKIILITILSLSLVILLINIISAAHYIVGIVENAKDGTSSNDHTILLWNPSVGISENLTDIIGQNGNSNTDNIYMIDCELLPSGCNIGENLTLKVIDNGDNYISEEKNVTVNGFGYDIVENITMNSPPNISSVTIDDSLSSPPDEIDLIPADIRNVTCSTIITEYDGENSLVNATGRFFDNINSHYSNLDDNNQHYTNDTCLLNYSYGNSYEVQVICSFGVWYYANAGEWNCTINATDNSSINSKRSDLTSINTLLALGLDSLVEFSGADNQNVSDESILNVTNYGNVKINLSLSGYAFEENDGYAMNCSSGTIKNISINYQKFNLTSQNPGVINLSEFENKYVNLTSSPQVKKFNLDYRKNDALNDATNSTYWRIYVPIGVGGSCSGNIVFGAVQAPGD